MLPGPKRESGNHRPKGNHGRNHLGNFFHLNMGERVGILFFFFRRLGWSLRRQVRDENAKAMLKTLPVELQVGSDVVGW